MLGHSGKKGEKADAEQRLFQWQKQVRGFLASCADAWGSLWISDVGGIRSCRLCSQAGLKSELLQTSQRLKESRLTGLSGSALSRQSLWQVPLMHVTSRGCASQRSIWKTRGRTSFRQPLRPRCTNRSSPARDRLSTSTQCSTNTESVYPCEVDTHPVDQKQSDSAPGACATSKGVARRAATSSGPLPQFQLAKLLLAMPSSH